MDMTNTRQPLAVMQVYVAALLISLASASFAQTTSPSSGEEHKLPAIWINPGFYSAHFDTDKGLRNSNPGFGVEVAINQDWSATAGEFINSNDARSNYVGAYYQAWHIASWKFGVVGGAFNGYPNAFNGGWFPALLPVATWEGERLGLNIAFVPPLQDRLYGAISFQLKLRVN